MLKMFHWLGLIAAIVLILAIAGAIVSSSPPPESHNQNTATNDPNQQTKEKDNKTLFDRWFPDSISVYTLFLVVFTGVLAFGGLYQLNLLVRSEHVATTAANAARDSAKAAKDAVELSDRTAERQLRAYVYLQEMFVTTIVSGEKDVQRVTGYAFQGVIKNVGLTPAVHVESVITRGFLSKNDPEPIVFKRSASPNNSFANLGSTITFRTVMAPFEIADILEAASRKKRLFLLIRVRYQDLLVPTRVSTEEVCAEILIVSDPQVFREGSHPFAFNAVANYKVEEEEEPK